MEETLNEKLNEQELLNQLKLTYAKMHTPWRRMDKKVGRNEICPYCDSGKKFKNCSCYAERNNVKYTISK